ncbi:hypothetical protein ABPG72_022638 [Tetrahymena utriculariae]
MSNQQNSNNLCILPAIRIKCLDHPHNEIKSVCCQLDCEKFSPFICQECNSHPSDHKLEEKDRFLLLFSHEIEKNVKIQQQIYDETIGKKENLSLLRWIEDSQNHMIKLQDYIKAQKFQVEQDIDEFIKIINKTLKNIQEKSFQKFDEFLDNYKQSLETFQLFKDDVFQLNQKFKYFCNPNILASKLINQNNQKASKTINEIKKAILIAQETNLKSKDFVDNLHLSLKELNSLIDDLPSYSGAGMFQEELTEPLQKKIEEFYMDNLQIHKNAPITLSLANYKENRLNKTVKTNEISLSMKYSQINQQNIDIQSIVNKSVLNFFDPNIGLVNQVGVNQDEKQPNKLAQFNDLNLYQEISSDAFHEINYPLYTPLKLNIKEIGKFNLYENDESQFQYTSMTYLGYNLIALAGKEPHVYDMISKKIYTPDPFVINKHYQDLISIEPISPLFQPLHFKDKIIFATSSLDSSIVFWTIDKKHVINSFQKLLGFLMPVDFIVDLQDGARILAVDGSNEIQLLEYHNYRWLFSKKLSQSRVTDIKLTQNQQVVVALEDGQISVLKLNISYNSYSSQSSSFEEILQFQTGVQGVTSIGLIPKTWDRKNFYILGCKDGSLKLFDIIQKKVMATFNCNQGELLDHIILRESKKCAFSIVYLGQSDKCLKAYHFAENSNDNVIIQEQILLNASEFTSSQQGQYKIQIIPSLQSSVQNSPLILILSETHKHIMVLQVESQAK